MFIAVIGAGLAGCECASVLANTYGLDVVLFEMKPGKTTAAHHTPNVFAELVCSNSLKSTSPLNPASLLKNEMRKLDSIIIACAEKHAIAAGETLAVDRDAFANAVTTGIKESTRIKLKTEEVNDLNFLTSDPDCAAIVVATGPLTSPELMTSLVGAHDEQHGYFYDAIAPILNGDTVDLEVAFWQNRATRTEAFTGKIHTTETGDYLNIPLEKKDYENFVTQLLEAPKVPFRDFEKPKFFSACQPIEALAESGFRTLSFGPMKPKGIISPHTGKMPYACVQLRKENENGSALNMVGFQTRLTYGAQKEVFSSLPGLSKVEFFRFGSMHRNSYICASTLLNQDFSLKQNTKIFVVGQLMGVEGYIESAAMGLLCGHLLGKRYTSRQSLVFPSIHTSYGALLRYLFSTPAKHFSPVNIHWGLFDSLGQSENKREDKSVKRNLMSNRATAEFSTWFDEHFKQENR